MRKQIRKQLLFFTAIDLIIGIATFSLIKDPSPIVAALLGIPWFVLGWLIGFQITLPIFMSKE